MKHLPKHTTGAFTLIELSIVLVIIGLIVGGVLVGKDLIEAATIRKQLSQIESFKVAANTFRLKYNGLPGDLKNAVELGFNYRFGTAGHGDGNGFIEGGGTFSNQCNGESLFFWQDLSASGFMSGILGYGYRANVGTVADVQTWIPKAEIGNQNSIHVMPTNDLNELLIIKISAINQWGGMTGVNSNYYGLTPTQALDMDTKTDDGLPDTGRTRYTLMPWVSGTGEVPLGQSAAASAGRCGNTDTTPTSYNLSSPYAKRELCGIRFKF